MVSALDGKVTKALTYTMRETGLDGWGNVEKGQDEKDRIKSSVSFVSFS